MFRWGPPINRVIRDMRFNCGGPPKDHLAANNISRFVVEYNTYNITGEESSVAYLSLAGSTSFALRESLIIHNLNIYFGQFPLYCKALHTQLYILLDMLYSSTYMRHSLQERGKWHRIIFKNIVNIKFHNKFWAAFWCQMRFRWFSPLGCSLQEKK